MNLEDESGRLTDLLRGKTVRQARRKKAGELLIDFDDGSRLFVNAQGSEIELSVTGQRSTGSGSDDDEK